MDFLRSWVESFWFILVESGVWLIFGFGLAGAMHALIPGGFIERQLSGRGAWPIAKASLMGIPLPLCSCSVIPVASGLRRGGASRGASAAFAISTPQTGEESIPLTWALFGPVFAIARPIVAVGTALTAGLLIEGFGGEHKAEGESKGCSKCGPKDEPEPVKACCSGGPVAGAPGSSEKKQSCCSDGSEHAGHDHGGDDGDRVRMGESFPRRLMRATRHGFVTMPVDLAPWLAVGLVLAGVISASMPEDWIAEHVGTGIVPMLAMLVIGVPLYICATSSTPLAFSLVAAGLSPGAALVLLLAGPATNVATISWALKDLGVRATAIYLATIAGLSLACGLAFDALLGGTIRLASEGSVHAMDHGALYEGGAVALLLLLVVALAVRGIEAVGPMLTSRHAHG
ncbi:MAG: SO_0444 family Cu/Zn efflux transporter [Phycisphaerales bacterium JB040]